VRIERTFLFLSFKALDGAALSRASRAGGMEHSHRAAVALPLSRLVDALSIVGSVHADGRHRVVVLLEQCGHLSAVPGSVTGQF